MHSAALSVNWLLMQSQMWHNKADLYIVVSGDSFFVFFATNEGKRECTTCELATWPDTGIGQLAIDVSNSVQVKIYRNAAHTPRWDPQSDLKERRKTFNVFYLILTTCKAEKDHFCDRDRSESVLSFNICVVNSLTGSPSTLLRSTA